MVEMALNVDKVKPIKVRQHGECTQSSLFKSILLNNPHGARNRKMLFRDGQRFGVNQEYGNKTKQQHSRLWVSEIASFYSEYKV